MIRHLVSFFSNLRAAARLRAQVRYLRRKGWKTEDGGFTWYHRDMRQERRVDQAVRAQRGIDEYYRQIR